MNKGCFGLCITIILGGFAAVPAVVGQEVRPARSTAQHERKPLGHNAHIQKYGNLALSFEANRGQTASDVKFLARARGYTLFLTPKAVVLSLRKSSLGKEARNSSDGFSTPKGYSNAASYLVKSNLVGERGEERAVLRFSLLGANPQSPATGLEKLPGTTNYFIGNDPRNWATNIPTYARVRFEQVYRGVDIIYYGNQREVEYDLIIAPGADLRRIQFSVEGGGKIAINPKGDLVLRAGNRELRLRAPVAYQELDGSRRGVATRYLLAGRNRVGFEVSTFDANKPLIIDPILSFSSYLGGIEEDSANGIAVDAAGNVYVSGATQSLDFPITAGVFQSSCAVNVACGNAFITKINPVTGTIQYSTYLGGHGTNQGNAIVVDGAGNAYIAGETFALDFPVTPGAFQQNRPGSSDAFVTKLNTDGSALLYSTYLGGLFQNRGLGIAVDASGNAYITGVISVVSSPSNTQPNFPVTPNAAQVAFNGGLPCPLTGSCDDGFVTKLNPSGSALVYSTYLGGSALDDALAIAVDSSGSAYVTGVTESTDFPTTSQAFQKNCTLFPSGSSCSGDAFITKLSPDGSTYLYSTYLGGNFQDLGTGISVDAGGNAYVTGITSSTTFPVTAGAFQTVFPGTLQTAFVTKMNPSGSAPVYSTYLGGTTSGGGEQGHAIATDSAGHAYITGIGTTFDFPEVNPIQASNSGNINVIVSEFNPTGDALVFSTHLGGNIGIRQDLGQGIVVDNLGNIYVAGVANRVDFPTVKAFQPECAGDCVNAFGNLTSDAFVAKISPANIPGASVSPTTLLFPSTSVGSTSQAQPVVLRDVGSAPLAISAIQTTGDFAESNTCGTAVNGGGNCTISVSFTPTASGTRTGTLTIQDSAAGSPQVITLSGTSPGTPQVSLSSNSLSFGTVLEGTTSVSQPATLSNIGNAPLNISNVAVVGVDYTQTNNCGSSIAAGANCTINVSYTPTSSGTNQTRIDITDNATNSPQSISLSGTGTEFLLKPASGASTSQTVTAGQTAQYMLTLTPSSTTRDTVTLSCSGAPATTSCSVLPTLQTFTSTNPIPVSVGVSTTARGSLPGVPDGRFLPPTVVVRFLLWLVWLAAFLLLVALARPLRYTDRCFGGARPSFSMNLALLACLSIVLATSACGGGGTTPPPPPQTGTPAGNYNLLVTAKSASSTNPDQTVALTLTVR